MGAHSNLVGALEALCYFIPIKNFGLALDLPTPHPKLLNLDLNILKSITTDIITIYKYYIVDKISLNLNFL